MLESKSEPKSDSKSHSGGLFDFSFSATAISKVAQTDSVDSDTKAYESKIRSKFSKWLYDPSKPKCAKDATINTLVGASGSGGSSFRVGAETGNGTTFKHSCECAQAQEGAHSHDTDKDAVTNLPAVSVPTAVKAVDFTGEEGVDIFSGLSYATLVNGNRLLSDGTILVPGGFCWIALRAVGTASLMAVPAPKGARIFEVEEGTTVAALVEGKSTSGKKKTKEELQLALWNAAIEGNVRQHPQNLFNGRHFCVDYSGCTWSTTLRKTWEDHLHVHKFGKFVCSKKLVDGKACTRDYLSRNELHRHESSHDDKTVPVNCPIEGCPKMVKGQRQLSNHLRDEHTFERCTVPGCNAELLRALMHRHYESHKTAGKGKAKKRAAEDEMKENEPLKKKKKE